MKLRLTLPNARPIGFSDGPRNQLSHNTIFSSALLPLRNHLLIVLGSIFFLSDKVLRRPVELAEQQRTLAGSHSAFVEILEARPVPLTWRFTLKHHRSPERSLIR
jgi:hypothetical protein